MKATQVAVMSGYATGSLPLAFSDATTAPGPLGFTKAALDVTFGAGAGWQAGRDVRTGVVWLTKILTDPFHDVMLYYRAPLHLMGGQLIDPMDEIDEPESSLTLRDA